MPANNFETALAKCVGKRTLQRSDLITNRSMRREVLSFREKWANGCHGHCTMDGINTDPPEIAKQRVALCIRAQIEVLANACKRRSGVCGRAIAGAADIENPALWRVNIYDVYPKASCEHASIETDRMTVHPCSLVRGLLARRSET